MGAFRKGVVARCIFSESVAPVRRARLGGHPVVIAASPTRYSTIGLPQLSDAKLWDRRGRVAKPDPFGQRIGAQISATGGL